MSLDKTGPVRPLAFWQKPASKGRGDFADEEEVFLRADPGSIETGREAVPHGQLHWKPCWSARRPWFPAFWLLSGRFVRRLSNELPGEAEFAPADSVVKTRHRPLLFSRLAPLPIDPSDSPIMSIGRVRRVVFVRPKRPLAAETASKHLHTARRQRLLGQVLTHT